MDTIILTTCNNAVEAYLIKGMLENNGIKCFLTNENISSLIPHYNGIMDAGVQIIINKSDIEQVNELLLSQTKESEIVCPCCGSLNVSFGLGTNKIKKFFVILISLLAWIPFGNLRNSYYCNECKAEFKT
ncbi:MAG: DUF2007 domain-containing protein [Candidatus Kapabacteria bacterium]|nr:DUF2007 domain-containing protein [Candidatus Kapabacteria bacterium]